MSTQLNVPAGEIIEEETSTWLKHPNAFIDPVLTPLKISPLFLPIIDPRIVNLAEVKRRVRKDRVDSLALDQR
jgi:hypothetical protein